MYLSMGTLAHKDCATQSLPSTASPEPSSFEKGALLVHWPARSTLGPVFLGTMGILQFNESLAGGLRGHNMCFPVWKTENKYRS